MSSEQPQQQQQKPKLEISPSSQQEHEENSSSKNNNNKNSNENRNLLKAPSPTTDLKHGLSPTRTIRESLVVGALKEEWPKDVAAIVCISRRCILRYRITNRLEDGSPAPGVFELVRIRTDARADEYGEGSVSKSVSSPKKKKKSSAFPGSASSSLENSKSLSAEASFGEESKKSESEENKNNEKTEEDDVDGCDEEEDDAFSSAPNLVQSEVVAATTSAALNRTSPLPAFASFHHFRVPLPSALTCANTSEDILLQKQQEQQELEELQKNQNKEHHETNEHSSSSTSGTKPRVGFVEPTTTSEKSADNKKAVQEKSSSSNNNNSNKDKDDVDVTTLGGIDSIDHNYFRLIRSFLKERNAEKLEPDNLSQMKPANNSGRDRIFAISYDGMSFAIINVNPPALKPRKQQPIRVQFFDTQKNNNTSATTTQHNANATNSNANTNVSSVQKAIEEAERQKSLVSDPPLLLRRTGSFPFAVTSCAMFVLSFTDMGGLSEAYRRSGASAPVVGPLPFPTDASMSRCMKELSRMNVMCLRQKHCCLIYSSLSGDFAILEMSALSSDDVQVAATAVVASGNIGTGWSTVVWAGPLCRSSNFPRAGNYRPHTMYRVRFFCYNSVSGQSQMETITIPCEALANAGVPKNQQQSQQQQQESSLRRGSATNLSASTSATSNLQASAAAASTRIKSRRHSTIAKITPTESQSSYRNSSFLATPFSISGQRMCIMTSVTNDTALLPLDRFDESRALQTSCAAASSSGRLTATSTTPWTRFYEVASRVSFEAWKEIELKKVEEAKNHGFDISDVSHDDQSQSESESQQHQSQSQNENDDSGNGGRRSPLEQSYRRSSTRAHNRRRRPTAVVAQAIMQEKVFTIPELEWSRFVTIHERYTDGGNYDEVLCYSSSRGCAWISRIGYEDRWHVKSLEQRLDHDLAEDEKEDEKIQEEIGQLQPSTSHSAFFSSGSGASSGSGKDGGGSNTFGDNSINNASRSGIAPLDNNNNLDGSLKSQGSGASAGGDASQNVSPGTSPRNRRARAQTTVIRGNLQPKVDHEKIKSGERYNARAEAAAERRRQMQDKIEERRRAGRRRAYGGNGSGSDADVEGNHSARSSRHTSPRHSQRHHLDRSSGGRIPHPPPSHHHRHGDDGGGDHHYQQQQQHSHHGRPSTEPSELHGRSGTSTHHRDHGHFDERGRYVKPTHASSSFAPLLFPNKHQQQQQGGGGELPPRGGSARHTRPFSGSGHYQSSSSQQQHNIRPGSSGGRTSLPQLAYGDDEENISVSGSSSRPGSSSQVIRRTPAQQRARAAAKSVAEKVSKERQTTPLEESQRRRKQNVAFSLSELSKLGVGEDENGGDETEDLGKIIGFMKKNEDEKEASVQRSSQSRKSKKKQGEGENEDEEENVEDQEEENENKSIDARIYARAQELLESGDIDDKWIEAAFRHLDDCSAEAEAVRRSNAVFNLQQEKVPTMQFPLEPPEDGDGRIKRAKHRDGWHYVLSAHGLPPPTARDERGRRKYLARHKKVLEETILKTSDFEAMGKERHPRKEWQERKLKDEDKKRYQSQVDVEFNPETKQYFNKHTWNEELLERFGVHSVRMYQKRYKEDSPRQLDKEAQAHKYLENNNKGKLRKTFREVEGTKYSDMVTRLSEQYVVNAAHAKERYKRENDKEFSKMFVPAVHHASAEGGGIGGHHHGGGERVISVQKPGALSPERRKEVAERLSIDSVKKREQHMQMLEHKLEQEHLDRMDSAGRRFTEAATSKKLSEEEVKEMADRLSQYEVREFS